MNARLIYYTYWAVMIFLFLLSVDSFAQTNGTVDTVYYDSEWTIAPMKEFATYRRIAFVSNDTSKFKNMYRDFYTATNTLYGEGGFITFDKNNPSGTIYNGKCMKYYKNGNTKERCFYKDGVLNGEYTSFFENGYLEKQCIYINGKENGLVNMFDKDGKYCTQIQFTDGLPSLDYYTISNQQGLCSRYRISDNKPFFEPAESNEMSKPDDNGFFTVTKNGVSVSILVGKWQYYGNHLQLRMNISNLTLDPISFNPNKIEIQYLKKNKKKGVSPKTNIDDVYNVSPRYTVKKNREEDYIIHPLTAEEYADKIRRKQNVMMGLYAFTSALSDATQAYSTTTTTSTTTYSGSSTVTGNAYAYGGGGYASAYFGGRSDYNGTVNSTTTSTTYDPYRAYQARMITQNKMQEYRYAFNKQLEEAYEGYMTPTTIQSAQTACGHVNAFYTNRFDTMKITVYINDTPYTFEWNKADYE